MSEDKTPYGKPDTLSIIESILGDYYKRGSSMQINELLDLQDRLSIHSYRLAEKSADAKTDYNGLYFIKEISLQRDIRNRMKGNISKAAATVEAETTPDAEERFKAELEAEAEAYKLDLLLKQVNKVLSAMQQRISYLKEEKNREVKH